MVDRASATRELTVADVNRLGVVTNPAGHDALDDRLLGHVDPVEGQPPVEVRAFRQAEVDQSRVTRDDQIGGCRKVERDGKGPRKVVGGAGGQARSIAAQVLCNLALSDPDGRMLTDFPAQLAVTKDERFVYDAYRRLVQMYATVVLDVPSKPFGGTEEYAFTPDSRGLLFTTDEGHEFAWLARYDLASGQKEVVLRPEWDVVAAAYSRGGRYLVVSINNDARTEVRLFDAATLRPLPLPPMAGANLTGVTFARDESRMAFYVNDSRSPHDLFVWPVGGEPRRLTRALNPAIDREHLVDAQVVRFASYDGVQVPGILYRPHGASAQSRAPALVLVHGGPGGQARVGYEPLIQFLVNHGYVVYDINNRGSSGYGKTFYAMDDRRHGEADLGDVVASKQMLIRTGFVDPERIGIMGGSYGGFMVLAAMAFQPREFAVGVNFFGVANWLRTLQSIPAWWEAQRVEIFTELGDPATDEERLRRISPLFHASAIRRPLIVLQGANDPRVLQVESDEIVAAVRANGVPVEYIVFPDEGHGFANRANEIRGYQAVLEFLDTHLRGPGR